MSCSSINIAIMLVSLSSVLALQCQYEEAGYVSSCQTKPGQSCLRMTYDESDYNLKSYAAYCIKCPKAEHGVCGFLNKTHLTTGGYLTGGYVCCKRPNCNTADNANHLLKGCETKRKITRTTQAPPPAPNAAASTEKPNAEKSGQQYWLVINLIITLLAPILTLWIQFQL